jgi:hypothetical protein
MKEVFVKEIDDVLNTICYIINDMRLSKSMSIQIEQILTSSLYKIKELKEQESFQKSPGQQFAENVCKGKRNAIDKHKNNLYEDIKFISAFTSQELLEIIREKVKLLGMGWYDWTMQNETATTFYYCHKNKPIIDDADSLYYEVKSESKNLAEDCAEFLIYLLEQQRGEKCAE